MASHRSGDRFRRRHGIVGRMHQRPPLPPRRRLHPRTFRPGRVDHRLWRRLLSWRPLYTSRDAPPRPQPWLPHYLGYGGAIALQLGIIALIALFLIRYVPAQGEGSLPADPQPRVSLGYLWNSVFVERWTPAATGTTVGVLGAMAYFRVAPLGVTSQLGSIARTVLSDAGMLTGRLNGLDTFSGCVTAVIHTISDNGLLISGLAAASLAMAVAGQHVCVVEANGAGALTALLGGFLMGWGSMIALGCTVGTLLSGIMALSVSGWIFFASVLTGVWGAIKLGLHVLGQPRS